jgi:glucose-6-phosphate 1-dehydrogenase
VIFGITGDLARQMTFRALYRLERNGKLDFPIFGVGRRELDDDKLRAHARDAIAEHEDPLEEEVFVRLARRLNYVRGDIGDADLHHRLKARLDGSRCTAFYMETPPSSFATIVEGLDSAGALRPEDRVLIEKPFGYDLKSSRELAAALYEHLDESQIYRIDHFLGKLGIDELLYLRFGNTTLEPIWNSNYVSSVELTMAEVSGLDGRGNFYEPVGQLRDDVVNHLMQVLAAGAMEAPSGSDPSILQESSLAVFRAVADADPKRYVRGQFKGYRELDGVDPGSQTETFAALELRIENWRWQGVPFLIRTGKTLPVKATELRLIFKRPPPPLFLRGGATRAPDPAQIVVRLDPRAGVQIILDAQRADREGMQEIRLDTEFPAEGEGGGGPTPYELLLGAAIEGDHSSFVCQANVDECWRIVQPLLDSPPAVQVYEQGSWGPAGAAELAEPYGGWHAPWAG